MSAEQGPSWLRPDWPAPVGVQAVSTLRPGGVSSGPYAGLNLGDRVGDAPEAVAANRALLCAELGLSSAPVWLSQVHGINVTAAHACAAGARADGAWTERRHVVCAVTTADCLPVLLCDRDGTRVAALHAGWRGLAGGVVEQGVSALGVPGGRLLAWLGPAIGPQAFEVGDEVRSVFAARDPGACAAFSPARPGHWFADLYALARQRLAGCGVKAVYGGSWCTYSDRQRFYSYRRDRVTGRSATLIWLS